MITKRALNRASKGTRDIIDRSKQLSDEYRKKGLIVEPVLMMNVFRAVLSADLDATLNRTLEEPVNKWDQIYRGALLGSSLFSMFLLSMILFTI